MLKRGVIGQLRNGWRRREAVHEKVVWAGVAVLAASMIFSIALVQVAFAVAAAAWVWGIVASKGKSFRRTPLDIPLLAFVAARCAAIPLSIDPALSLPALHKEIVFYLLFFVVTHAIRFDAMEEEITVLWKITVAAAVIAALYGSVKYLVGAEARASSSTSGYYTLGLYLSLVLPLALFSGGRRGFLESRVAWIASCLAIAAGIIFTFDRLHWVGMAAAIVIAGIVRERKLILGFVVVMVILAVSVPDIAHRLLQLAAVGSNTSGRDVLWRGAWMLAGQHPVFGFGLRTFPAIFPLRDMLADPGIGSWHNDYVQVYMDSGLTALVCLAIVIAAVYRQAWKAFRSGCLTPGERNILAGSLVSLTLFFLMGGFLDILAGLLVRILLAVVALLAVRSTQLREAKEETQGGMPLSHVVPL